MFTNKNHVRIYVLPCMVDLIVFNWQMCSRSRISSDLCIRPMLSAAGLARPPASKAAEEFVEEVVELWNKQKSH